MSRTLGGPASDFGVAKSVDPTTNHGIGRWVQVATTEIPSNCRRQMPQAYQINPFGHLRRLAATRSDASLPSVECRSGRPSSQSLPPRRRFARSSTRCCSSFCLSDCFDRLRVRCQEVKIVAQHSVEYGTFKAFVSGQRGSEWDDPRDWVLSWSKWGQRRDGPKTSVEDEAWGLRREALSRYVLRADPI